MGFYKQCPFCGHINEADKKIDLRICQNAKCSRNIANVMAKTEEEYNAYLKEIETCYDIGNDSSKIENHDVPEKPLGFYLYSAKYGITIPIPEGESIIGRAAVGKNELEKFISISREHLQVKNKGEYLLIKDISRYGTSLDGTLISDNEEHFAIYNASIKLHKIEFKLLRKEQ